MGTPSSGFQVYLTDANLHDLVQLECLGRASGVFSVRSLGRVGFLHVADGALVHAECGRLEGEAAALEILSWQQGEFRKVQATRPASRTIDSPLQALLMQLAQSSDEAAHAHRSSGTIPSLPTAGDAQRPLADSPADALAELELGPSGDIVAGRGVGVEVLAARVAYAARLAELIGRSLRSGKPRSIELQGQTTCTEIEWSPEGGLHSRLRPSRLRF